MRTALVATIAAGVLATAPYSMAQQRAAEIQKILLDSTLWGRDFLALMTQLGALRDAGEPTVYVFADRAAGSRAARTPAQLQAALQRGRAAAAKPAPMQSQFAAAQAAGQQAPALRLELAKIIDGDGLHVVVMSAAEGQFLAPGLTIETVRNRLGPSERVTQQTIHAEGESKPVVLTLHNYAGGAVAFAESNMTEPGVVERAVLNLGAVAPVVLR